MSGKGPLYDRRIRLYKWATLDMMLLLTVSWDFHNQTTNARVCASILADCRPNAQAYFCLGGQACNLEVGLTVDWSKLPTECHWRMKIGVFFYEVPIDDPLVSE